MGCKTYFKFWEGNLGFVKQTFNVPGYFRLIQGGINAVCYKCLYLTKPRMIFDFNVCVWEDYKKWNKGMFLKK